MTPLNWQQQPIGLGVTRCPPDSEQQRKSAQPVHPDNIKRIPHHKIVGHGNVTPHTGPLRHIGLRWQSEIGIGSISLFEPGYNPKRLHFTQSAAQRRANRP